MPSPGACLNTDLAASCVQRLVLDLIAVRRELFEIRRYFREKVDFVYII